jgi:hypothetical protein
MTWLRLFQHLLPRSLAWRTTVETALRRFFAGLSGLPSDVRTFVDLAYLDVMPSTTRELAAWEKQFALAGGGSQPDRRGKLAAAWSVQGQQSPDYIQRTLHAAGFTTVFVHEWWQSGPPYSARDPRAHTTQPRFGVYQCELASSWQCFDPGPTDQLAPHCDKTLANDPGYVVNLDLTRRAPPTVPDDPSRWPYFLYLAAETFPELAPVLRSRVAELKELILRIAPAQQWIVLLVDPIDELEGFGSSEFGSAPFGA